MKACQDMHTSFMTQLATLSELQPYSLWCKRIEGQQEIVERLQLKLDNLEEADRARAEHQQKRDEVTAKTVQSLESARDERIEEVGLLRSELENKVKELGELREQVISNLQDPEQVVHVQQQLQQETLRANTQATQCADLAKKLEDAKADRDSLQQTSEEGNNKLKQEICKLTADNSTLAKQLENLASQQMALLKEKEQLQQMITRQQQVAQEAERGFATKQAEMSVQIQQLTKHQKQVNSGQTEELECCKQELVLLDQKLQQTLEVNTNLKEEQQRYKRDVETLTAYSQQLDVQLKQSQKAQIDYQKQQVLEGQMWIKVSASNTTALATICTQPK